MSTSTSIAAGSSLELAPIALKNAYYQKIIELLNSQGIAFFKEFSDKQQLIDMAKFIGEVFHHRDSDEDGITYVKNSSDDNAAGMYGFTPKGLSLHTDRSTVADPPNLLILGCKVQSSQGGETILADGREILRALTNNFKTWNHPLIEQKNVIFDDGKDNFKGNIFVRENDGSYTLRYRRDEFAYFSSPLITAIDTFENIMMRNSIRCKLQAGEGYIINNRWWLHGRDAFAGQRELLRILAAASKKNLVQKGIVVKSPEQVKEAVY